MTIQPDQPNSPRHAQLKASWRPGQKWETLVEGCTQWVPVGNNGFAEPTWDHHQEYREAAEGSVSAVRDASPPLRRPERFEFALEVVGEPEATELRQYIEALERAAGVQGVNRA